MECETGIWDADECDDTPDESAPDGCSGILILSEKQSNCGRNCSLTANHDTRSHENKKMRAWTLWHS